MVGITISSSWSEPNSDAPEDIEACERKLHMEVSRGVLRGI